MHHILRCRGNEQESLIICPELVQILFVYYGTNISESPMCDLVISSPPEMSKNLDTLE